MTQQTVLWQPSEDMIKASKLNDYMEWLQQSKGLKFDNYESLWLWSSTEISAFWASIFEYFEVIDHSAYKEVLSDDLMPKSKWFKGTRLNYAEHIFRHKTDQRPALIFQNESLRKSISWSSLTRSVKAVRKYFKKIGIAKGDRVAGYLPNIPEANICFLAANSLGAIWSCCSPDFGVETVIERFAQIEPKCFITTDGYSYSNKAFNRIEEINRIRQNISSITNTLFIPYLNQAAELENSTGWSEIQKHDVTKDELIFEAVPFDHPIWVLYSSGTTGKPKAITHSHGGVLLEHLKYMALHNDVKKGEHFFWYTTTGWMMWNFLQASMLVGAVPILYDGSPAKPSMNVLWRLTETLPIHHFGTSAPYLTACMKKNLPISKLFNLDHLRSIGSTGAPLPPEVFEWIYKNISPKVWLCSMSGGTDVCTAFVGGNPLLPVYKGAIQSRALGCALHAYDEHGDKIIGSLGEMVIEEPMPSMPIYFWNDKNNERYLKSYFAEYEGKWRHGDWIKIFENGSLIIQGRSDATLNRKGIRIGTAEIYSVLDKFSKLKDALILNLEMKDGEDIMPLFVVTQEDVNLDENLVTEINEALKQQCSSRHVPDQIIAVPDIPYTLSGKKMEVPIKKIFMKMDISKSLNKDAVRNPAALDHFIKIAEGFDA